MTHPKPFFSFVTLFVYLSIPSLASSADTDYAPLVTDLEDFSKTILTGSKKVIPTTLEGLINFSFYALLAVAVVLAIFGVIRGGYVYLTSGDNANNKGRAKRILQASVGGLLLALGGWLILKTINPEILKFNPQYKRLDTAVVQQVTISQEQRGNLTYDEMEELLESMRDRSKEGEALSKITWTAEKELAVREKLKEMGVLVNNDEYALNRVTDVAGLQESTISGIRQLLADAGVSAGETVWLTGGSESYVHSGAGEKNHHTGYKADFRGNLGGGTKSTGDIKLDTYLNSSLGGNSAKTTTLSSGQTITILKESNHWDIKFH
jgi:hypothetical protein